MLLGYPFLLYAPQRGLEAADARAVARPYGGVMAEEGAPAVLDASLELGIEGGGHDLGLGQATLLQLAPEIAAVLLVLWQIPQLKHPVPVVHIEEHRL